MAGNHGCGKYQWHDSKPVADSGRGRSARRPNRICRWCDYRDHHGMAVHSLDAPRKTIHPVGDWFAVGSAYAGVRGRTGAFGSQLFLGTNGVDYEIAQGGLMLIGLAVLLFAPLIAATLRGANHST